MADNTQFKKGQIPWNKTQHLEKTCKCGKTFFVRPSWARVRSCSIPCGQKGKPGPMAGKKMSAESREKMRQAKLGKTGELCPNYRGKGDENYRERRRFHDQLQMKIFQRDNYTCQVCDAYGASIQVDHIKSWAKHPELRFEESNCRTLCMPCHYYLTFKRKMPEGITWGHNFSRRIAS